MLRRHLRAGLVLLFVLMLPLVSAYGSSTITGPVLDSATTHFRILAIGNSFSQDAMEHLYQIAADAGAKEIVLANLYIGGATLPVHWNNAQRNLPQYRYDKNVDGVWRSRSNTTLLYGLQDEQWDLITLQQASGYSGVISSYTDGDVLQNLIDYVNANKANPDAKLGWHMTWAYQSDSTHASFPTYNRDQFTMFTTIVNAVRNQVVANDAFDIVIPAGTAIQNVRTSYIGDTLTRDGYHLSLNLGRYIAGLTWLHSITGWSIDDLTYVPSQTQVPDEYMPIIKEAVKAAVANPFAVSISSYVDPPHRAAAGQSSTADAYTLLEWDPVGCAYWQSNSTTLPATLLSRENSTASNLCFFVSSGKMFTREDIPVGSIIEIDEGYQYRPEGWVTLTRHASRPGPVTTQRVVVTNEWWGDYQYRAFNISFIGNSTNISNVVDETAAKFRIYIPR